MTNKRFVDRRRRVGLIVRLVAVGLGLVAVSGCDERMEPPVAAPVAGSAIGIADDGPGSIWIASHDKGTFWSTTAGHSWTRVRGTWGFTALAFLPGGTLLGDGTRLRFATSNGGRARGLPSPPAPLIALATPYPPTGRLYGLAAPGHLWISARSARKWQPIRGVGIPASATCIAAVRRTPTTADIIYVGAPDGVWASTDFGIHFHRIPNSPTGTTGLATTTDDPGRLLVASTKGIYVSVDGASTFQRVFRQPVVGVAYDWQNWRNAVALTTSGSVLRSPDGGLTW